jgi:hypothetical protein
MNRSKIGRATRVIVRHTRKARIALALAGLEGPVTVAQVARLAHVPVKAARWFIHELADDQLLTIR